MLFTALSLMLLESHLGQLAERQTTSGPLSLRTERVIVSALGIGLVGGILTRPEGLGLAGLVIAALVVFPHISDGKELQTRVVAAIVSLISLGVLLAPYIAFNLRTAGSIFPNTFYAKQAEYGAYLEALSLPARFWRVVSPTLVGAQVLLQLLRPRSPQPLVRIVSDAVPAAISVLARQQMTDTTSGFRAVDRQTIRFLVCMYPRDYPEPEAIVLLCREGFRLLEFPVAMRARTGGQSSIRGLRGIYYMIKVLLATLIDVLRNTPGKERNSEHPVAYLFDLHGHWHPVAYVRVDPPEETERRVFAALAPGRGRGPALCPLSRNTLLGLGASHAPPPHNHAAGRLSRPAGHCPSLFHRHFGAIGERNRTGPTGRAADVAG